MWRPGPAASGPCLGAGAEQSRPSLHHPTLLSPAHLISKGPQFWQWQWPTCDIFFKGRIELLPCWKHRFELSHFKNLWKHCFGCAFKKVPPPLKLIAGAFDKEESECCVFIRVYNVKIEESYAPHSGCWLIRNLSGAQFALLWPNTVSYKQWAIVPCHLALSLHYPPSLLSFTKYLKDSLPANTQ